MRKKKTPVRTSQQINHTVTHCVAAMLSLGEAQIATLTTNPNDAIVPLCVAVDELRSAWLIADRILHELNKAACPPKKERTATYKREAAHRC